MALNKNSLSHFERESSLKSSTTRLRKFIRIHAIRMNLRSVISAALTPKLPEEFLLRTTSWVRLSKSVLFNGSLLALAYTIAAFCIRTISRNYMQFPSLPKAVVGLTLPLALYNDLYIVTGYLVHLATIPSQWLLDRCGDDRR